MAPVLLGLLVSGCSSPQDLLAPHGYIAGKEAWLFWIVLAMGTVVFLGVEGLILFIALRDRRRKGDLAQPEQVYGNRSLEFLWTAIPIGLVRIPLGLTWGVMVVMAPPLPPRRDSRSRCRWPSVVVGVLLPQQGDVNGRRTAPAGGHGCRIPVRVGGRGAFLLGARTRGQDRRHPRPRQPHEDRPSRVKRDLRGRVRGVLRGASRECASW